MRVKSVVLSDRAHLSMTLEARAYPDRETGGIFLGTVKDDVWYVLETIDPGYRETVRRAAYFEYDQAYVTHLANVKRRLYRTELSLLGLWHRHPGSFDRFSPTDDGTNIRFAEGSPDGAISALVNMDPGFRITMYHVTSPLHYQRVREVVWGDVPIPREIRAMKRPGDLDRAASESGGFWKSVKQAILPEAEPTPESDPKTTALMRLLEAELDAWLDGQTDYTYDLRLANGGLDIMLHPERRMPGFPAVLRCRLTLENGRGICTIDGCRHLYWPGVIKSYLDQRTLRFPLVETARLSFAVKPHFGSR